MNKCAERLYNGLVKENPTNERRIFFHKAIIKTFCTFIH